MISGTKSRWLIFYSVILAALALNTSHAQNLVANPGFESGTNDWFGVSGPFTISGAAHSGTASALVSLPFGTSPGITQFLPGKLQPGQAYTWSAWMRVSPAVPPPARSVAMNVFYTESGNSRFIPVALETLSTTWTEAVGNFSFNPTGAVSNVRISFDGFSPGPSFAFYLDDVSISNSSPMLAIERTNGSVIVSWPSTAVGYSLQGKANIFVPTSWSAVTNSVETNGNILFVTLPAASVTRSYRLRKP